MKNKDIIIYKTQDGDISINVLVVNQHKAETKPCKGEFDVSQSLQYISVGHRPTERNAPQIQALKGRHFYYALANVDKSINSSNIEIFKSLRN